MLGLRDETPVIATIRGPRGWPRRIGTATAACAIAATIAGCGGALPPPNLRNIAQIQEAIQQTLAAKQHLNGKAYCPQTVPEVQGEVFSCVVAVARHAPVLFTVTEANDLGSVSYVGQ